MKHIISGILLSILLIFLQIWVFDAWNFMRIATPFPYIFILCLFPISFGSIRLTTIGFFIGLILDFFCGTPGLHTSVMTFLGFVRRPLLTIFIDDDINRSLPPSINSIGKSYFLFLFIFVAIHNILLFFLDGISNFDFIYMLIRAGASIVFTYVMILMVYMLVGIGKDNKV